MYRVLIADDESFIRVGLKCLLDWEGLGFSIVGEAEDGEEAYRKIKELQPDVVLLDIRMPGMTGLELVSKLRAEQPEFSGRILILSGCSEFKYAQEAIRLGVTSYLTKPVDGNKLEEVLKTIRKQLDEEARTREVANQLTDKVRSTLINELLLGSADVAAMPHLFQFHLDASVYQVVIYEKYSRNAQDASYSFSELLRVTNQDHHSYDHITLHYNDVLLLKGDFAIKKFNEFLDRYKRECKPQKDSPLDSLFLAYGQEVHRLQDVSHSYDQAYRLLGRRFFCDQEQHTIGYESQPDLENNVPVLNDELMHSYADKLLGYLQSFNRNMVAQTLSSLQENLYNASDSIGSIKLFLVDLFLQIKEQLNHLYESASIPFPSNAAIIRLIGEKYYLYEILLFFTEQFEVVMSSIGNSSRDSVLDDIINYIDHNYANNITLENIAPLFGYNSSYLGKIFSKRIGENFNSYVDHIRIERSKELLQNEDIKVYTVAERVGYRNVDYFHIKFKKYVGQSPAEFRRKSREA
jgi:two-component system response regulator YesN